MHIKPMEIGLLLYPGCMPAGLFAFTDLLQAAQLRMGQAVFNFRWVSLSGGRIATAGMELPSCQLDKTPLDALVIGGAWRSAENIEMPGDVLLAKAIAKLHRQTQIWSYCTGVYLAALAGRLTQQAATTTWWLHDVVQRRFPDTQWQPSQVCVFGDRVATASGVTGYQPLALALIEHHSGGELVNEIRKYMVLPRPQTQHNPFHDIAGLVQRSRLLRNVVQWVEATPATDLQVEALAAHLHMSSRSLSRKLQKQTRSSTGQLMRRIKLNQASDLLIASDRTISSISDALGFADDSVFRRSFKQVADMPPGDYRRRFGY